MSKIKKYKWVGLFVIFCIMFYMFPMTGDDFGKKSLELLGAFEDAISLWKNYNGRVLGNVLVDLLNYSVIFKVSFSALVITLIIYFVSKINNYKNFSFTLFLILLLPIGIFREAIAWMSGFANYSIPVLTTSIILFIISRIFKDDKNISFKWYVSIILFFCGFMTNMFAEHTAIFSVILSIGIIIVTYIIRKKIYKEEIFLLLGSSIGCILMFLSPVYFGDMPRLNSVTFFQNFNIFQKIYYNLRTSSFMQNLVFDNYLLFIIIGIIFITQYKKKNNVLSKISMIVILFLSTLIIPLINYSNIHFFTSRKLQVIIVMLLFLSVIYLLWYLLYNHNKKKFYFLTSNFISYFLVSLPLLASYQFGPRCFFSSYLFIVIFILILIDSFDIKISHLINISLDVICIMIFIILFYKIIANYNVFLVRNDNIKQAISDDSQIVNFPKYPYVNLIHMGGILSTSSYQYKALLSHYGLPENTVINYYSRDEYNKRMDDISSLTFSDYITIPSYDGSNEPTHPSVLVLDTKVSGYQYWMAYTPWPNNQNKLENPSIVASNDGINWIVPEGLTNPISGVPTKEKDYYSDPCLLYSNGIFELWYRFNPYDYNGEISLIDNNLIFRRTSVDGINWSDEEVIFDDEKGQAYMSISVVHNNNNYEVWYVNYDNEVYYRKSKDLTNWTKPKKIVIDGYTDLVWHGEIKKTSVGYEALLLNNKTRDLVYTSSSDGINFVNVIEVSTPELEKINGQKRVYKSSMIISNNKVYLYVPYNIITDESHWSMYLSIMTKDDFYKNKGE